MKHVGPTRAELGTRTMFNLLGPQSNPAGARRYMLGVYAKHWVEPVAAALLANRAITAWVVHGDDGLDELSTTGPSFVASIKGGNLTSFEITPEDAGLPARRPRRPQGRRPGLQRRPPARPARRRAGRLSRHRAAQRRRRLHRRRPGRHAEARRRPGGRARSTAAAPRQTLEKLIAVSNRLSHDRYPHADRSLQARGDRRRQDRCGRGTKSWPRRTTRRRSARFLSAPQGASAPPASTR